jgi:hypothetical protein
MRKQARLLRRGTLVALNLAHHPISIKEAGSTVKERERSLFFLMILLKTNKKGGSFRSYSTRRCSMDDKTPAIWRATITPIVSDPQ